MKVKSQAGHVIRGDGGSGGRGGGGAVAGPLGQGLALRRLPVTALTEPQTGQVNRPGPGTSN